MEERLYLLEYDGGNIAMRGHCTPAEVPEGTTASGLRGLPERGWIEDALR